MSKTLLLADDSVTIQKVVAISFASEDIQITTVDNGDAAVTRARELRPDVILADVVMPGKSGYEVCETLKADPALRHIPVLLLTGTFEAFDEERAQRAGAAGHVAKPFEAQALVQRVRELLTAPPAAIPPAPTPAAAAPSAASADEEAFAFFEDDGDAAAGENALSASELELAPGDSAFSFGDEDWSSEEEDDDSAPELEPVQPVAHTVAILPDEDPADAPRGGAPSETVLSVPPEPGPSDSGFDFEFEGMSPTPRQSPADSFAEGAVLDPPADSGFVDPAPSLVEERPAPPSPSPSPEATQVLVSDFDVARSEPLAPPETGQSTDPFQDAAEAEFVAPAPERQSDAATAYFEERPIPPLPAREAEESPAPLAAPAADLSEPEADFAVPEPRSEVPRPDTSAAVERFGEDAAEAVLAQVTPQLRDRLHETLERAAWEAFGQVTEKIVAQAVEKLEAIAWEVVPKLAETLIQEEIRKLKGDEQ
jgi:CheY-like chemotaxis protein